MLLYNRCIWVHLHVDMMKWVWLILQEAAPIDVYYPMCVS